VLPPIVVVGAITKPHGVRGEVVVHNRSDNPDRWVPGAVVYLGDRALTVASVRERSADRLLVAFEGIGDRDAAAALRGEVTVPQEWLPELEEGQWWPSELTGCEVVTERGRALGRVVDVIFNPANDLWVARDDRGAELLIPALADVVRSVDVGAKRIVVREVPGLTVADGGPPTDG
jgi:16S rRNA processing protein RimM